MVAFMLCLLCGRPVVQISYLNRVRKRISSLPTNGGAEVMKEDSSGMQCPDHTDEGRNATTMEHLKMTISTRLNATAETP